MPIAEIITIGDELLSGETVDTNSNYLDAELERRGWTVARHTSIPDDLDTIAATFVEAAARSELVLSSGGLGPTGDDLTMAGLAQALGCALRRDEPTIEAIKARFRSFGREMTPNNERQAMVPEIGEVIENKAGTAPAFWAELEEAEIYLLPGVPREVRWLIERIIGPRVDRGDPQIHRRTLKVIGFGESRLEHEILSIVKKHREWVRFGYRAIGAENHIKLAARGEDRAARVAAVEAELRAAIGPHIFGADDDDLLSVVKARLLEAGVTVATAESCTGGLIGKQLTDLAGSSAYYLGGVVSYSNAAKVSMLGVSEADLDTHGAVSEPVARQMAEGARARFASDWALSSTGIAGPDGGTEEKPVGTVYVGLAGPSGTDVRKLNLPGDRDMIRMNTARVLIDALRRRLSE